MPKKREIRKLCQSIDGEKIKENIFHLPNNEFKRGKPTPDKIGKTAIPLLMFCGDTLGARS